MSFFFPHRLLTDSPQPSSSHVRCLMSGKKETFSHVFTVNHFPTFTSEKKLFSLPIWLSRMKLFAGEVKFLCKSLGRKKNYHAYINIDWTKDGRATEEFTMQTGKRENGVPVEKCKSIKKLKRNLYSRTFNTWNSLSLRYNKVYFAPAYGEKLFLSLPHAHASPKIVRNLYLLSDDPFPLAFAKERSHSKKRTQKFNFFKLLFLPLAVNAKVFPSSATDKNRHLIGKRKQTRNEKCGGEKKKICLKLKLIQVPAAFFFRAVDSIDFNNSFISVCHLILSCTRSSSTKKKKTAFKWHRC